MNKYKTFIQLSFVEEGWIYQIRVVICRNGTFKNKSATNCWKNTKTPSFKRHLAKRRNLGFIPMTPIKPGYDYHHVDNKRVVAVPTYIHQAVHHDGPLPLHELYARYIKLQT